MEPFELREDSLGQFWQTVHRKRFGSPNDRQKCNEIRIAFAKKKKILIKIAKNKARKKASSSACFRCMMEFRAETFGMRTLWIHPNSLVIPRAQ